MMAEVPGVPMDGMREHKAGRVAGKEVSDVACGLVEEVEWGGNPGYVPVCDPVCAQVCNSVCDFRDGNCCYVVV